MTLSATALSRAIFCWALIFAFTAGLGKRPSLAAADATSDSGATEEAETEDSEGGGASGLPLPRFVSVSVSKANMRKGPGRQYPIAWVLVRRNLPVEVVEEYEHWRKIRDRSGETGWIHKAMLGGKRTAIIVPPSKNPEDKDIPLAPLYTQAGEDKHPALLAQAGAIGEVRECKGDWCALEFKEGKGWVRRIYLWGVYPDEKIE